jgi:hypothetical protein
MFTDCERIFDWLYKKYQNIIKKRSRNISEASKARTDMLPVSLDEMMGWKGMAMHKKPI